MGTEVKFIVKGTGLQFDLQDVAPLPFDFKNDVLRAGVWEKHSAALLLNLFIKDMYPLNNGVNIFFWDDLKPHVAFSVVNAAMQVNVMNNREGVSVPYKPVTDEVVLARLQRNGIMSPKEVELNFAPTSPRISR
jgi:hypothetical protein